MRFNCRGTRKECSEGSCLNISWCTCLGRKSPCDVVIAHDYHDHYGRRTLVPLQENKHSLKVHFIHGVNLEEFLAGVDDDKVVVDM